MKYAQVSKDGQITLSGDPRQMYAVMLCMRMWIVCIVWRFTAYASIIAGRYAVTRYDQNHLNHELDGNS